MPKKITYGRTYLLLKQIIIFDLKDGRLLLGQCKKNSDDVCLFCLKWPPRPLYPQIKVDVSVHAVMSSKSSSVSEVMLTGFFSLLLGEIFSIMGLI